MKALTKTQIEYATRRINDAVSAKLRFQREQLTTGKPLSITEQARLIKANKVKPCFSPSEVTSYTKLVDSFDFSEFAQKFDEKKYDIVEKSIRKTAQRIVDELVLGDSEEAMKLINEFCK